MKKRKQSQLDPAQYSLYTRLGIAIVVTFVAMKIHAEITIEFGSTPFGTNIQSNGSSMDESFTFELGTFGGGFVPTSGNTDQWLANWTPLQDSLGNTVPDSITDYGTTNTIFGPTDGFASSVTLDHNNSPFEIGSQGYIWGYDSRDGTAEWILLTNTEDSDDGITWRYGDASPDSLAFTETWDVSGATETVVGSINFFDGGGDFISMQSGSVTLPPAVPEPATSVILTGALAMLGLRRRRPRRR